MLNTSYDLGCPMVTSSAVVKKAETRRPYTGFLLLRKDFELIYYTICRIIENVTKRRLFAGAFFMLKQTPLR